MPMRLWISDGFWYQHHQKDLTNNHINVIRVLDVFVVTYGTMCLAMQLTLSPEQVHVAATLGQYIFLPLAWWLGKRFVRSVEQSAKEEVREIIRDEMRPLEVKLSLHMANFGRFVKTHDEEQQFLKGQVDSLYKLSRAGQIPKRFPV